MNSIYELARHWANSLLLRFSIQRDPRNHIVFLKPVKNDGKTVAERLAASFADLVQLETNHIVTKLASLGLHFDRIAEPHTERHV